MMALLLTVHPTEARMCPDGSFGAGNKCTMAPDGSFVGGRAHMAPDGSFVGDGSTGVPRKQWSDEIQEASRYSY